MPSGVTVRMKARERVPWRSRAPSAVRSRDGSPGIAAGLARRRRRSPGRPDPRPSASGTADLPPATRSAARVLEFHEALVGQVVDRREIRPAVCPRPELDHADTAGRSQRGHGNCARRQVRSRPHGLPPQAGPVLDALGHRRACQDLQRLSGIGRKTACSAIAAALHGVAVDFQAVAAANGYCRAYSLAATCLAMASSIVSISATGILA